MRGSRVRCGAYIRPICGLVALFALVRIAGGDTVASALSRATWADLLPAAGLMALGLTLRTWRWQILLAARGVLLPYGRLLRLNLIAQFYNQFLPGASLVGTGLRAGDCAATSGRPLDAVASVAVEQVLDIVAAFGACSLVLIMARPVGVPRQVAGLTHLVTLASLGIIVCLRQGWGIVATEQLSARMRRPGVGRGVRNLSDALRGTLGWRVLARVGLLSVLLHAIGALTTCRVVASVAGPLPWPAFFAMTAVLFNLEGLPLTPGGVGVRESVYALMLRTLGVSQAAGVSGGLLMYLLNVGLALCGGLALLHQAASAALRRRAERTASAP